MKEFPPEVHDKFFNFKAFVSPKIRHSSLEIGLDFCKSGYLEDDCWNLGKAYLNYDFLFPVDGEKLSAMHPIWSKLGLFDIFPFEI